MNVIGIWEATAFPDRRLVFLPNGTGFVSVQDVEHPHFRWWLEQGLLHWQMFNEAQLSNPVSKPHEAGCVIEVAQGEQFMSFTFAPIPFGIKRFRLATLVQQGVQRDGFTAR